MKTWRGRHRGKVVEVKHRVEKGVIEYVDWGWIAEVRWEAVRILDHKFCVLTPQIVAVRCKGMEKLAMREACEDAVKQGRLKGKVSVDESGHSCMDLYIQYPGQMQMIRYLMPDARMSAVRRSCMPEQEVAMRELVRSSMARIREKESRRIVVM